jgi:ankyrin repeat protein
MKEDRSAEVGSVTLPETAAMVSSTGMDVGRSTAPVRHDYAPPFDFEGRIRRMVFDIASRTPKPERREALSAMTPLRFEFAPKEKRVNMRMPGELLDAIKAAAACADLLGLLLAAALTAPLHASAQTAPTSAQAAAYTGLHAAAHRGDAAAVTRLAATDRRGLEARDGNGRTPLHVATFAAKPDAIRALVAAGADTAALDADRYDAVTIAAVADDEPTLALLLSLGASAKLVTSRWDGTALIAAAHLGHDGVVRRLIAAGAPLDHINTLHWTALIEAIVLGDGGPRHQACVQALVEAGADTRIGDRQGVLPAELASSLGYISMVAMIDRARPRPPAAPQPR